MKKLLLILLAIGPGIAMQAQVKVGNNPGNVNAAAILELESSTRGFLPTRMSAAERDALSLPPAGLQLFNTTANRMEINTGTPAVPQWTAMSAGDLSSIALISATAPAGTATGEMRYNTNAAAGLPEGPVYWNGNTWISTKPVTANTIYTADDALTGNRIVSQSGYDLTFSGAGHTLLNSSSVGVGTTAPDPSARMDITSTTQGFLLPRMSRSQRDAIPYPALGLMVYCLDCDPGGLYLNNGAPPNTKWQAAGSSGSGTANLTCGSAVVSGTYIQGTAMNGSHYITIPVTVASTGTYSISSNTVNGVTFSGGGVFTAPGATSVVLYAAGGATPVASGLFTYAVSLGTSSCNISVNFSGAAAAVTTLDCSAGTTATPTLVTGASVPAGYTFSIPYTGGNGNSFSGSFVSSSHPGLTATAAPQTVSPSGGNLVFTVSGTPGADGTITFPITVGSESCNYTGMASATGIVFTSVSAGSNLVVPAGITKVVAKVWGAAGSSFGGYYGGYGGFVAGTVTVIPGETLSVRVGQGGQSGDSAINGGGLYGGGGYSALFRSATPLLIAGGGGGTGDNDEATAGRECNYIYGGSAGVTQGLRGGSFAVGASSQTVSRNTGGSQTAGGNGSDGTNGGAYLKGGPGIAGYYNGGGGGGGYYGGGGGTDRSGNISGDDGGGGGAGGSNYVAATGITSITNSAQATCVSTNTVAAPGSTDPDYNSTLRPARPINAANGSNGMVVIKWSY